MKRTAAILTISATILLSAIYSPDAISQKRSVVDRIIETGMTDNRTMDHLDVLSNRIVSRYL